MNSVLVMFTVRARSVQSITNIELFRNLLRTFCIISEHTYLHFSIYSQSQQKLDKIPEVLKVCNFIKKALRYFSVNIVKCLERAFFIEHLRWLLLPKIMARSYPLLNEKWLQLARRKKSPYSELFWSAFFSDFPTFGLNTDRYSEKNADQNNSEYGLFLRSVYGKLRQVIAGEILIIRFLD